MNDKGYIIPTSVNECMEILTKHSGNACIIAGGTDLMLLLQEGKISVDILVDPTRIPELLGIEVSDKQVSIGAAVTHAEAALNPFVRKSLTALADGCESVGSPQIRNIATLAGNIVSAQPAADGAVALLALGAEVEIVSTAGTRRELAENLYGGVGKSKVDHSKELITRFVIKLPTQPFGTAFARYAPREALSLPLVNTAVWLTANNGSIDDVRIVMGPVATHPLRAREAEKFLKGIDLDNEKAIKEAAQAAADEAHPRDSLLRGSGQYRKVLVRDLVEKTLKRAASQAKEGV